MLIIKVSIFSYQSPNVIKGLWRVIATNELKLLFARIILRAGKKGHGAFLFCVFFSKFISLNSFTVLSASDTSRPFYFTVFFLLSLILFS